MKPLDQRFRESYDEVEEKADRDRESRAKEFARRLLTRISKTVGSNVLRKNEF